MYDRNQHNIIKKLYSNKKKFLVSFKNKYGDFPGGPVEKAMAPHTSTLDWQIPWTDEPGRLQSMGSLGVRHN